ncbi:MAG: DNRLRE domain-containing protein [Bacillota bacterium]|nr:DNRLRE domain-containing protein [Bacillota bacterium]
MANKIIFSDYSVSIHSGRNSEGSSHLYIGVKPSGDIYRTLLHFDISSIPEGSNIENCTLNIYINGSRSRSKPEIFTPYLVTSDWGTRTTWDTRPSADSSIYGSSSAILTTGWISFDVTDIVNNWIDSRENFGLLIKSPEITASTLKTVAEPGISTQDIQPFLVIKYTHRRNNRNQFLSLKAQSIRRYTPAINVSSWDKYSIFIQNAGSNTVSVFLETGPSDSVFVSDSTTVLYPGDTALIAPQAYSFFIRMGYLSHGGPSRLNIWVQRPAY